MSVFCAMLVQSIAEILDCFQGKIHTVTRLRTGIE